jgi:hypothetical protein
VSAPFDDWPELFEPIEPLPAGLARLRERIDREKRHPGWLWLAPLAAGAVVLALWLRAAPVGQEPPPPPLISGASALPHPSAIALGLAAPTPAADGDVVFAWVDASQPRPAPIYVEASDVERLEVAPPPVAVVDVP